MAGKICKIETQIKYDWPVAKGGKKANILARRDEGMDQKKLMNFQVSFHESRNQSLPSELCCQTSRCYPSTFGTTILVSTKAFRKHVFLCHISTSW